MPDDPDLKPKRKAGRPPLPPVKGVPDTLEGLAKSVVKTRSKAERERLSKR